MKNEPKKLVVSYKKWQADIWIKKQQNPHEWEWLASTTRLRGYSNPRGMFIYNWYDREDIDEVISIISQATDTSERWRIQFVHYTLQKLRAIKERNII